MIGVRLDGRLGNQLFQYALVYSLAKKYKTFYVIDNDFKVDSVKKYFKTNIFSNNRISRQLFKNIYLPDLAYVRQLGDDLTEQTLPFIQNNQFYHGYFQSELFFQDIAGSIQRYFQIKAAHKKAFNIWYGHLFSKKKVLAIHYRLGDFLTWGGEAQGGSDLTLPESYYENALMLIEDIEDHNVVVVTDDKINIKDKLPNLKNKIIISHNEILDFQILLNADKIIASNSSFCWWAAYLNPKQPSVFAPRFWHGFKVNKEMPSNIIPVKFIKVDVY